MAGGKAESSPAPDAELGSVGPYRLVQLLGEGGMGSVYLAEQSEPIRRQVALKVIKVGMDTREVIRRFESERQSLAMMDHPGIARVLDAGGTESGRPYFVMERVEGERLSAYLDRRRPKLRERLELFVAICRAVQHAHQKGIIHRDLKPGNVLVSEDEGDKARPKIIDFGIAKAMGEEGDRTTLLTVQGQVLGTPSYMSPEQAGSGPVDTRTDIYALGCILYELLTGGPPLPPETTRDQPVAEILRRIRDEEAERPSSRRLAGGSMAQGDRWNLIDDGQVDLAESLVLEIVNDAKLYQGRARTFDSLLATVRGHQGRLDEAIALWRQRALGHQGSLLEPGKDLMWTLRHWTDALQADERWVSAAARAEMAFRCARGTYGAGHHLTTESAIFLARSWSNLGRKGAAYFLCEQLYRDAVEEGLEESRLREFRACIDSLDPTGDVARALSPVLEAARTDPIQAGEAAKRSLRERPEYWIALADCWASHGRREWAARASEHAWERTVEQVGRDDPRYFVRLAWHIDRLVEGGRRDEAESIFRSVAQPEDTDSLSSRLFFDSCERLIEGCDEAGEMERARRLDRRVLLPALAGTGDPGHRAFKRPFHRVAKHLLRETGVAERLAFYQEVVALLRANVPADHPLLIE